MKSVVGLQSNMTSPLISVKIWNLKVGTKIQMGMTGKKTHAVSQASELDKNGCISLTLFKISVEDVLRKR